MYCSDMLSPYTRWIVFLMHYFLITPQILYVVEAVRRCAIQFSFEEMVYLAEFYTL